MIFAHLYLNLLLMGTMIVPFILFHYVTYTNKTMASLVSLVCLFVLTATIYMYLDQYFLGLSYIIVYCGAIAILIMFMLMMVDLEILSLLNPRPLSMVAMWVIVAGIFSSWIVVFLYMLDVDLFLAFSPVLPVPSVLAFTSVVDYPLDLPMWSVILYHANMLPFLIVATMLWVVQVGVIKLVKP
jgi:NADH-quinone oxidoreductase subunit J